jgi:hypothetical protein
MKKKFFGIKIGTVFTGLLCLVIAFAFWFFVKYAEVSVTPGTDSPITSSAYES